MAEEVKDLGQFPSLDPKTGKLRPKHVPVSEDGATKKSVERLNELIDLDEGVIWGKTIEPPAWWITAVKAIGKTPLSLFDLMRNSDSNIAGLLGMAGSLSRQKVIDIIAPVIAANPDLLTAAKLVAETAVEEEFATKFIVTATPGVGSAYPNDLVYLGDKTGTPSRVGYSKDGSIADSTMDSAYEKGMVRVASIITGADGSLDLVTNTGRKFALGFDNKGQFSERTKWAIANLNHYYRGQDRPFVWEGNYIVWDQTDNNGSFIAQHLGDNR